MSEDFRIIGTNIEFVSGLDGLGHESAVHKEVLWQGNSVPSADEIDQVFEDNADRVLRPTQVGAISSYIFRPELTVQKRRPIKLLGWQAIGNLFIPAEEVTEQE